MSKTVNPEFNVVVDYSRSLAKMIKAGKYDDVGSDINEKHFPIRGKGKHKRSIVLLHFDQNMKSKEVIDKIDKQGYRSATIEELLALGEKYPDLQRKSPIVALGSVWRLGHSAHFVPYLLGVGSKRELSHDWLGFGWIAGDRFAAVRK